MVELKRTIHLARYSLVVITTEMAWADLLVGYPTEDNNGDNDAGAVIGGLRR
ncbi:hypothetical protein O9929_17785 [Vibrio lentus]|nr:hypothetical protein [Vibrio lentus]